MKISECDTSRLFFEVAPECDVDPGEGWSVDDMVNWLHQWGYFWNGCAWQEVRTLWMKFPEDITG